jgi:Arc/MetJ-type ribon-helix-helix transcriptional regulator
VSLSQLKKRTPEGRKETKGDEALRQTPRPSHPGRVRYEPTADSPPAAEKAQVIDLRDEEASSDTAPAPAQRMKRPNRPKRAAREAVAPEPQTEVSEPPLTVYLDHVHSDFAKDVTHAGTRRRPRVSISGAAVIRYALDRLRDEMTAEQAHKAIGAKLIDTKAGEGTTDAQAEKRPRISAYVDSIHRQYVDDVVFAGRRQAPRVNGSTVFRFAMDRLQAAMAAEQVCEAIAEKPIDDKATGRKRR